MRTMKDTLMVRGVYGKLEQSPAGAVKDLLSRCTRLLGTAEDYLGKASVYRNLFSNAIKYGGRGCTISFGFESHESHYRLNVYNSGRPIAEEDSHRLFAGFGRSRALNGSSSQGLGLGLHFIKKIILAHGGEICYEARPEGANFVFTLPKSNNS